MAEDLQPRHLADRLRDAATTYTENRALKREAATHIERLEQLLRWAMERPKCPEDFKALCERAFEA